MIKDSNSSGRGFFDKGRHGRLYPATAGPRVATRWAGLLLMWAACAAGPYAFAHEGDVAVGPPPRMPEAVVHEPSLMPDRIVMSIAGDAATTRAVTWRTSTDVDVAWAEIAPAEAGPKFIERLTRVDAVTQPFQSDLSRCRMHSVVFTGLKPATQYVYRVGDGTNYSEFLQFRTAPAADSTEPFSFVYFGDAQNDIRSMWSRVIRQAWCDMPRAAFMLHAGDLIDRAQSDAQWGEWFAAAGYLNAMVPVVASPGNHEYWTEKLSDDRKVRRLSGHWRPQFTFPENGPEGLEESAYWIDYQNLRVISLNSNERQEDQAAWLDRVLADNDRMWTVATFHHPIYSVAKNRDNAGLRELWKPIFDRYRVDLVLNGHDHTYGRTGPVGAASDVGQANSDDQINGAVVADAETNVPSGTSWRSSDGGTVYVVSVSGPKMYGVTNESPVAFRRAAEDTQLYQIITIKGPVLSYQARTALGDVYDAFTLEKHPDKANVMTDQVPDAPERRR